MVAGLDDLRGQLSAAKSPAEGENRLWSECRVRRVSPAGDTVHQRIFGSILEREGGFKFVSYRNDL